MSTPRVVVVGGGVAGLAAAHRLVHGPAAIPAANVTVLEASGRWGGVIRSAVVDGMPIDAGPEAFVLSQPAGPALCEELGLVDDIVRQDAARVLLWRRGKLRPLPPRLLEGAPGGLMGIARSGVLSARGLARASLDLMGLRRRLDPAISDTSVGAIVRSRLGREVFEGLVDPLVGGIHGGDANRLSAAMLTPGVFAAARSHRSLVRGLRAQAAARAAKARASAARSGGAPAPPFRTLTGGLGQFIDALTASLAGSDLRTGVTVTGFSPNADGRVAIHVADGEAIVADAVVLALPAYAAAPLLERLAPDAARDLAAIQWAPAVVGVLAYDAADLPALPGVSGALIPPGSGRLLTAITFSSRKWPHLGRDGRALVRVFAGRAGDGAAPPLDDAEFVSRAHDELVALFGVRGAGPRAAHLERFARGVPQYEPGHAQRVAAAVDAIRSCAPIELAGASYFGSGLGLTIAGARAAADRVAASVPGSGQPLEPAHR